MSNLTYKDTNSTSSTTTMRVDRTAGALVLRKKIARSKYGLTSSSVGRLMAKRYKRPGHRA